MTRSIEKVMDKLENSEVQRAHSSGIERQSWNMPAHPSTGTLLTCLKSTSLCRPAPLISANSGVLTKLILKPLFDKHEGEIIARYSGLKKLAGCLL